MVQIGIHGGRDGRERGVALLMVITTLVALMVIAVPFAISMRLGLERSEAHNARKRARDIVDSTMAFLEATLVRSTERVEMQNLAADGEGPEADPEYDSIAEIVPSRADLALTLGVLEEELHNPYGLIVGWNVEDENAKFNLNDASFFALGNLMGLSVLTSEFNEGDRTIELEDATNFPSQGYVKVGRELVKYTGKSGNQLTGCERGQGASQPEHGSEEKHAENDWVVNYAAWAIAYYHVARHPGEWTDFDALDVSDIASLVELDPEVPVLTQADWERVRPFVTVWSKGEAAAGWSNAQAVVEGTRMPGKADKAETFKFGNSWFYNTGTMIRIAERSVAASERDVVRDEKNLRVRRKDYAMCFSAQPGAIGESRMELFGKVHRRFDDNRTRVEYRVRAPININTAPREVLVALFANLGLRTKPESRVTLDEAAKVADAILERRASEIPLRSMRDFRDLLDELQQRQNVIDLDDRTAIYTNALNSHDQSLRIGTAPITFRSFDVYTLQASAIVCNRSGEQLARHGAMRVVEIGSQLTASRVWESQRDFEEQLVATADPRWWATSPFNTGFFVREDVEPWPRAPQQIVRSIFPYDPLSKQADEDRPFETREDRGSQVPTNGDISLAPARLLFDTAQVNPRRVEHFDNEQFIEGKIVDAGFGINLGQAPWQALDGDQGETEPFAISFWIQPRGGSGDIPIFDFAEDEFRNRYACYVDGETNELVFAVADNTDTMAAAELRYNLSEEGGFAEGIWYHVHLIATGAHPGRMTMIVDGRAVGKPNVMTFLAQSLDTTGTSIPVEDSTAFPDSGAVLIGTEVVEYESKTQGALNVRLDADGNPIGRGARRTFAISHPEGDVVTLFGYSRALVSTLPTGGAQIQNDLGPWSPTLMNTLADQVDNGMYQAYSPAVTTYFFTVTDEGAVSGPGGAPGATPLGVPLVPMQGQPPPPPTNVTVFTLPFEAGEWSGFTLGTYGLIVDSGQDTPTPEEQLRAFQEEGYALMAYIGGTTNDFENMTSGDFDSILGHVELVRYVKSGTTLNIQRQTDEKAGTQTGPDRGGAWEILLGWMKTKGGSGTQRVGAPVYIVPCSIRTTPTTSGTYINPPDDEDIDYWFAQILEESQGEGADESRIWEWIRYSEVLYAGDANYFLQARVVNQTLFLDSVHDVQMEESVVDALKAPLATGAGEVEALLAATPDKTYNNWQLGSGAAPPSNGNVRGMGDLVRLRGVQNERSEDGRFVDDWWQDENDPIIPDGTPVIAVAATYGGPTSLASFNSDNQDSFGSTHGVWPLPGRFDRVNVVSGDDDIREGDDLFCWHGMDGNDTRLYDRVDISGTGSVQPFQVAYNVHLFALERDVNNRFDLPEEITPSDEDLRDSTRLLCFPTGEMPDNREAMSDPRIAMSFSGQTFACVIDEISGDGREIFHALTLADEEIDEGSQSFSATSMAGAPDADILPEGPGLVRIGDELIAFREAEVVGNVIEFTGCTRGVMRTLPRNYSRGAPVEVMFNVLVGVLTESLADSSSQIFGLGVESFPRAGVVRIESPESDQADLRLYTTIQQGGLTMPISDIGAGMFTARYGTTSLTHESGTPFFYQPIRVWDRFAEFADDPEMAFFGFSTELRDAYVKRVYWDEGQVVPNVRVRCVVRLDEGTEWNARNERQLRVDTQSMGRDPTGGVSNTDRARLERSATPREFLFVTESRNDDNLINLQASKIEARFYIVFETGAYVWNDPTAIGWKSRFPIQRFAIEYVQQNRTLLHIDKP